MEQETGHTSAAESLVVSLGSADNDGDHESGVTAIPVHFSEKQTEPIDGSGDDENVLLLTLLTAPAPHLLGTSISPNALVVEASSPQELDITVPEISTPSGISIIKEEVKQFEQERVENAPVLHPMPATPLTETKTMSSKDSTGHEDNSSGTDNSSGMGSLVSDLSYLNATPIIPFNSTYLLNITEVNDTENVPSTTHFAVAVTLIPDMTLTPIWDPMTPPTPPQEFRADVELSSDTPVITDDPDFSAESDSTAAPTTENPEETQSLTSSVATNDQEREDQDLIPTTESPNSKEEEELTTPTHHTTPPPRLTERVLDRTGRSGIRIRIKDFSFYNLICSLVLLVYFHNIHYPSIHPSSRLHKIFAV